MAAAARNAVVLAGSSGAIAALGRILPKLPARADTAFIVLMHLPEHDPGTWPEGLRRRSAMPVAEAADRAPAVGGCLHAAPAGYHLLVEADGTFALSLDARESYVRPSADVLLDSAADCWRERLCAVMLSGANDDGAHALPRVHGRGGYIVVQDPGDAAFSAMPEAAIATLAANRVVTADQIAGEVIAWLP